MSDHAPVGIDLGTTYSAVAHLDSDGRPWTILNAEGDLTTPSVVFFDRGGAVVGKEALSAGEYEPERLAQFAKRDMGEKAFSKTIRGQQLPAEVVQAIILKKLKEDAELKLGTVTDVVVTVPAFFNEPCRKATQDAGRLAGLNVLDIINEPTAAAICYGVQQGFLSAEGSSSQRERILIYDLGGGTFDVTVMEIDGTDHRAIATAGDVYLGGIDWDERLAAHIAEAFYAEHGVDPRDEEVGNQALLLKAAEAKHSLTSRDSVTLFFNYEGQRLKHEITRATFEELTSDLLDRTMFTVRQVLREAKLEFSEITRLLLVGGSTRMPAVLSLLEQQSGLTADRSLSPDEAVAHGAAIYAGILTQCGASRIRGMSVTNVNSHDLGILGVEAATGRKRRGIMLPRNSQLPVKVTKSFPTLRDGQTSVDISIIEGGDDSGNNSTPIGRCSIRGLPAELPAKTPVQVSFKYQTNGRLVVKARLPSIGADAKLEIERAGGLDDDTIAQWVELVAAGIPDDAVAIESAEVTASESVDSTCVPAAPVPQPDPPAVLPPTPPASASVAAATDPQVVPASTPAPSETILPGPLPEQPQAAASPVRKLGTPVKKLTQPIATPPPAETLPVPVSPLPGDAPLPTGTEQPPGSETPPPQPKRRKSQKKSASPPDWKARARKLSGD